MSRNLRILLALLFLLPTLASAQRFSGGGFAGLSASQISGDGLAGFDKPGLHFGAFAALQPTEVLGWQFELGYIDKGSRKLAKPTIGDYYSYKLGLNYINTSLLVRYMWNKNVTLETGPSFGVLVRSKEIVNEGSSASRMDQGDHFDNSELAWNFGAVHDFGQGPWSVSLRYVNSVLPVRPHASGASYLLNFGQYSQVLVLTLRYRVGPQE